MFKKIIVFTLGIMILVSCAGKINTETVTEQESAQFEQVFPPVQDVNYIPNSELGEE